MKLGIALSIIGSIGVIDAIVALALDLGRGFAVVRLFIFGILLIYGVSRILSSKSKSPTQS